MQPSHEGMQYARCSFRSSALGLCLYLQSPHAAGFDQKQGLRRASALWLSPRQTYAALSLVPAMDILGVFPAAILEGPWFVPRAGPAGFPHPGSRSLRSHIGQVAACPLCSPASPVVVCTFRTLCPQGTTHRKGAP